MSGNYPVSIKEFSGKESLCLKINPNAYENASRYSKKPNARRNAT